MKYYSFINDLYLLDNSFHSCNKKASDAVEAFDIILCAFCQTGQYAHA